MKKILSISLLLLVTATAFSKDKNKALSRLYLRAGAGYAFQHAGDISMRYITYNTRYISGSTANDGNLENNDLKRVSFSSGFNGLVGFGYMFNNHLGVEITAAAYATKKYRYVLNSTMNQAQTYTITYTTYAKTPVLMLPSVVLTTGSTPFAVYTRLGLALPISGNSITCEDLFESAQVRQGSTFVIKNSFSVGFTGAIGGMYRLGKHINAWVEASGLSMSLHPKTGKFALKNGYGADALEKMPGGNPTYYYGLKGATPHYGPPNESHVEPSFAIPFSNIGFALGFAVNL